jgi:DNA (cytosine-5)-methyltransferase 1
MLYDIMLVPGCANFRQKRKIYAIDLFCTVGALTRGLEKAGIDVLLGIDTDSACEFPCRANNRATFVSKSVEDVTAIPKLPTDTFL